MLGAGLPQGSALDLLRDGGSGLDEGWVARLMIWVIEGLSSKEIASGGLLQGP